MLSKRQRLAIAAAVVAALAAAGIVASMTQGDPPADGDYRPREAAGALPGGAPAPRIAIDEAHHETHRADGRFAPLARLLRANGFEVVANDAPFTAASLAPYRVLVIGDALGARLSFMPDAGHAAFTADEIAAVDAWVRGGGSLLLAADHAPAAGAATALAARFGVSMSGGRTFDPSHADTLGGRPSWMAFVREDNGVRSHPVTDGGAPERRVRRAVTFTGQSLGVPDGATALLALPPTAKDLMPDGRTVSAAGRAQAVALFHGSGRVMVVGDAAMLTALVTDRGRLRPGVAWPGTDDERFALNGVRWLAGVPR